ncbi:11394_t:CDS:2 [Entrophospora sp. SA101]|nr:11394_t:CDS:2 [Entrophospora sp. SA101]
MYHEEQNPPETLQTHVGKNFRWPSSTPEYLRKTAFQHITDVKFDLDDEVEFNLLFFYNLLDNGEFTAHENERVTEVDQKYLPCTPPAKRVIVQHTGNSDDYKVWIWI